MTVSRGSFLKICGAAVAALLGSPVDVRSILTLGGRPSAAAIVGGTQNLQDACASLFREHLHTTFTIRSGGGAGTPLVLARVTERLPGTGVEQFSLIFRGPGGAAIPEGTHLLRHAALGDFDLFIAPIGASSVWRSVYEACFSRRVRSETERGAPAGMTA